MNEISTFWLIIYGLALTFFLASLREARLLSRMHHTHPERGLYWFNMFFLLLASGTTLLGGLYLDTGRAGLESLVTPYPGARYAHEQNSLIHGNTWVYVSIESREVIHSYYKAYAVRNGLSLVSDATEERIAFHLPSGDLFLTLSQVNGKTVLYFSREGSINVVK